MGALWGPVFPVGEPPNDRLTTEGSRKDEASRLSVERIGTVALSSVTASPGHQPSTDACGADTIGSADPWCPSDRSKGAAARQKRDVLRTRTPLKALEHSLLGLWCPEDLEALPRPSDSGVEDVVG